MLYSLFAKLNYIRKDKRKGPETLLDYVLYVVNQVKNVMDPLPLK